MAIIEQVSAEYNVDPKVIFLAGHSNGGFMSYRMAIFGTDYPSAQQTVQSWAADNGCDTPPTITTDALDLDEAIDGAESAVESFGGCEQGSAVELWIIDGGSHTPGVTADFSAGVVDFLLAHPKP